MTFHIDQGFQPAPPSGIAAMNPNQMVDMMKGVRDIQGQNALGAAYAAAVDPTTGQIDPNKLQSNLAGSKAPWMTGVGGIQAGQAMQATNQGQQSQVETAAKQMEIMNGMIDPLLQQRDANGQPVPIHAGDLQKRLDWAASNGSVLPQYYGQVKTWLSKQDPNEDLTPVVKAQQYATQAALTKLGAWLPQNATVGTGSGTYFGNIAPPGTPNAGAFSPSGFVAQGLNPEQWMTRVTVIDPKTQLPTTVPQGVLYGQQMPGITVGNAGGALSADKDTALYQIMHRESNGQNVMNSVAAKDASKYAQGYTASGLFQIVNSTWKEGEQLVGIKDLNQYPRAMDAPAPVQWAVASALYDKYGEAPWRASSGGATAAAPPQGTPRIAYTPPSPGGGGGVGGTSGGPNTYALPGPNPYKGNILGTSAKQYSDAVDLESNFSHRMAPIQGALAVLHANPDLQTGTGQTDWNNLKTFAAGFGLNLGNNQMAAYETLGKYLVQMERSSEFATNKTDLDRLDAKASMPNLDMRREAVQELVARQVGAERLQLARLKYFRSLYPNADAAEDNSEMFRSKTSQWMSNQDQNAYALDTVPRHEMREYEASLKGQARDNFWKSYQFAKEQYGVNMFNAPP